MVSIELPCSPWLTAPLLWLAGVGVALASWPLRRAPWAIAPAMLILFALPSLQSQSQIWLKLGVVLAVGALLPPKLLDLGVGRADWNRRTFGEWARFVLHPAVLVYRRHGAERTRTMRETLMLMATSALQMAAGTAILIWVRAPAFWPDHLVKLAAGYLLIFSGGFQLVTALCRLAGSPVLDGSLHPILAVTPADFWRRYNRVAGQLFYEDVFKPLGGLRRATRGILAVFLINGLLHEYLSTMVVGRVLGLQMAFFVIQGFAVAATARLRPRGAWIAPAWAATFALNAASSVLFFASFDRVVDWYG